MINNGVKIRVKRELPHPNYDPDTTTNNAFMLMFLSDTAMFVDGGVELVYLVNPRGFRTAHGHGGDGHGMG